MVWGGLDGRFSVDGEGWRWGDAAMMGACVHTQGMESEVKAFEEAYGSFSHSFNSLKMDCFSMLRRTYSSYLSDASFCFCLRCSGPLHRLYFFTLA